MSDLISRADAISALDCDIEITGLNNLDTVMTYIGNAVQRLKQLPGVAVEQGDTISRRAAIDAVNRAVTKEAARWSIQELPSAQPTGRWRRHAIGHENTPWGFDCSVCNKWFVIGEDTANQYNYCPNCGADMSTPDNSNRCVCCGEIIPEGRMVCPTCERKANE